MIPKTRNFQKQPPGMFCKEGFLKNLIHGEKPVPESIFNKASSWRPGILTNRLQYKSFHANFLETAFLYNNSGRLLLNQINDSYHWPNYFNSLSVNPIKWPNTLEQLVGYCRRIVWVYLTVLWGWRLKS